MSYRRTRDFQQMDSVLLYNTESYGCSTILDCIQDPEDLQPILCEKDEIVVAVVKSKIEMSAGVDYIPV